MPRRPLPRRGALVRRLTALDLHHVLSIAREAVEARPLPRTGDIDHTGRLSGEPECQGVLEPGGALECGPTLAHEAVPGDYASVLFFGEQSLRSLPSPVAHDDRRISRADTGAAPLPPGRGSLDQGEDFKRARHFGCLSEVQCVDRDKSWLRAPASGWPCEDDIRATRSVPAAWRLRRGFGFNAWSGRAKVRRSSSRARPHAPPNFSANPFFRRPFRPEPAFAGRGLRGSSSGLDGDSRQVAAHRNALDRTF